GLAAAPGLRDLLHDLEVLAPGAVRRLIALRRVLAAMHEERVRERADDRLGVLVPNRLEDAPRARDVDRLVTDRAEVAHAEAPERRERSGESRRPCERRRGNVCFLLIPGLHRVDEGRSGTGGVGEPR